tara:strand:- start:246 stop:710 length:465 start_codon:yes stop_codon:yes gene_type:complete
MGKLEESGMSIGDFAMSLMDEGKVSKKIQTQEVARPAELPVTQYDISDVAVSDSLINSVLQESFGIGSTAPKHVSAEEPMLSEQELLQEKIISLKEELVETINKLSSLVSEMTGIGMTTTQSIGTGYSSKKRTNVTGKYRGRNKRTRTIKRSGE